MALRKDKELEGTGLILSYHKVESVSINNGNDSVQIEIGLYSSKEASQSGKRAVSTLIANAPSTLFRAEGDIVELAYNVLKESPEYEGALDV